MAAYFTHLQRLLRAQSRSYSESIFLRIEASVLSDAIRSRRCQFALLPSLIRPAVALLPTPDRLSSVTMKSHCPGQLRSPLGPTRHHIASRGCRRQRDGRRDRPAPEPPTESKRPQEPGCDPQGDNADRAQADTDDGVPPFVVARCRAAYSRSATQHQILGGKTD